LTPEKEEPANQQRLVDLLARVTDVSVRSAPGFISSALHRSLDATKVTMYAQWRTIEDYGQRQHLDSEEVDVAASQ
jgi:hypothetical protein